MRRSEMTRNSYFDRIQLSCVVFLLLLFSTVSSVYADADSSDKFMKVDIDSLESWASSLSTLEEGLNYMGKNWGDSSFKGVKIVGDPQDIIGLANALRKDVEEARRNGGFLLATSHTIEQTAKTLLGKMPQLPATFGSEDFTVAISRHIGTGKADIDTITSYLDGLNKACWAVVGYMVGGPEGAKVYQSISGAGAKLLRDASLSLFNRGVLAWRGQGRELVNQWLTLQEGRMHNGLPVLSLSEVYGVDLLQQNGVNKKEIQQWDAEAYNLNQTLSQMKKDISVEKIDAFKRSGKLELGGVYIDPELICVGKANSDIKQKVLDSRPSEDAGSWDIELPEEE